MDIQVVDDAGGLDSVGSALAGASRVALDCEAAGYHRYSDRLCLLQLTVGPKTFLLDPLAVNPEPVVGPLLRDPAIEVVMHGADYDIRLLERDLGIALRGLIDTQIAAALIGSETVGLSSLLENRFGIRLSKKYQKADWAQRPLPDAMREYAAHDTSHLHELAEGLLAELDALDRVEWAREECRELEKVRFEPNGHQDPVTRVKLARGLGAREVDRLREALEWRDEVAREWDRALFRVVGDGALVEAVRLAPQSVRELESVPGMNRNLARSRGGELLRRFTAVDSLAESELRGYPRTPRTRNGNGRPTPEVEERLARLKEIRNAHAEILGIARGTLLPNGILQLLAESPPANLDELAAVEGMRKWQAALLGKFLLDVL
ncbi:MAG: HRDC domain-containing protein [Gemmatimonadota bacterium]